MGVREAYVEKAAAQLHEWQTWITIYKEDFADHWEQEPQGAQHLEDCYQIASLRISELSASRGNDWEIAKESLESAMIELKRAIDENGVFRAARSIRLQGNRHSLPVIHRKKD